jgi:hypothetical protein
MTDKPSSPIGARMLPAFCPAEAPPGEREVYHLLANDPNASGWTVLHSLDIAEHVRNVQGEADYVVLIPDEGIVVLEVKSHASVRFTEHGWWLGNSSHVDKRGPFRQASEALHSIRKYLEQHGLSESVPMISAVVFPSLAFQITSSEWHSWQVLDKQGLHARPISASLLSIIRYARDHFSRKGLHWVRNDVDLTPGRLEKIVSTLRPRFDLLASPASKRVALEDSLLRCTEQQYRILDEMAANSRLLVSGLAGTGKTTMAVEAVRREKAATPDAVIGFFCFNRLLGKVLTEECAVIGDGIRVGSLHSWMLEFSEIKPVADQIQNPDFWSNELPERCIARMMAPGAPSGILDLLVLDEAQDLFLDAYLDLFDLLLENGLKGGRWRFFGDFRHQDIYAQKALGMTTFYRNRVDERCAIKELSENCRNTQEIAASLTLHSRLQPGYSRILREDTRHDPEIILYSEFADQLQSVVVLLEKYFVEGFKPSEIILLSPHREKCLARTLANHPSWKGRLKEYAGKPRTVTFGTVHAFKGLEAPVVILTDIDSLSSPRDYDVLYVGMSRALHRLAVLYNNAIKDDVLKACLK